MPPRECRLANDWLTNGRLAAQSRGRVRSNCRNFASENPPYSIIDNFGNGHLTNPDPCLATDEGQRLDMPRRSAKPADADPDGAQGHALGEDAASPGAPGSVLGLLGISEDAPAPELREAVARLAAERDRLQAELARARSRIASLEHLADEDSLTPVANRRAFVRQLSRMIAFTHRYGAPASMIYFDINNMKQINDAHGHPAGDAALRHIATVLRTNIRSTDIVGRLGGDEFGVILAHTNEQQAHDKAAALANAISDTPLRWGDFTIEISAAFGVHAFSGTEDPQHAIEEADRAMYQQKRATGHAGD
jgi:diguanylate cyclase (GGDEF)-like protein